MSRITSIRNLTLSAVAGLLMAAIILLVVSQIQAEPAVVETSASPSEQEAVILSDDGPLDLQLRAIITENGLTGDPSMGREIPGIDEPIAQLGKRLFFTQALGGDMDSACASCHLPTLGGGDDLPLSIGVGADDPHLLGPGRTHHEGEFTVPRNAPTTFNMALWDKYIFHDGRIESLGKTAGFNGADGAGIRTPDVPLGQLDPMAGDNLTWAQSRFPTTSPEEMRGFDFAAHETNQDCRDHLAARLGNYGNGEDELAFNNWIAEFESVYGSADDIKELVTEQRIAEAIGEYERSQLFVDTPWKSFVEGDDSAMSESAKRGALLFYSSTEQGGADCASCHGGDFFTDEEFYVLAVPQIGRGKGDGLTRTDDFGRFRETRQLKDLYAFRTPSLINATVTGPWGHDGAYATLEAMVRHNLNPAEAVESFDWDAVDEYMADDYAIVNTRKALTRLEYNRRQGLDSVENVDLTDAEFADLMAFLEALTDPCVTDEACLAPWMPAEDEMDPDGQRLDAYLAVSSE
jgi:cytochrome c peroxidase